LGGPEIIGWDMLPHRLTAVLLSLPLLVLLFVSISYWITFSKEEEHGAGKQHIDYNKFFLTLVAIGYFGIWLFWLSGIVLLLLERYYSVLDLLTSSFLMASPVQIVGLVVLYVGSMFFAWAIGSSGKYLRPSKSGVHANHKLMQDGPLGVVQHPYYVSYVVILLMFTKVE
jgi:protein-S-isoprenylcysteine O-methyltransferase Ste14